MFKEFKEFAIKGNVIDVAVGVVIGAAFGKITAAFVSEVLMPPIGLLVGKIDFKDLFISLNGKSYATLAAAKLDSAPTLNYGLFLNSIIDFTIVAFAIFLFVKQINRLRQVPPAPPAPPAAPTKDCPYCCTSIPIKATRCAHCTSQLELAKS